LQETPTAEGTLEYGCHGFLLSTERTTLGNIVD
jgi:hypothetical protein